MKKRSFAALILVLTGWAVVELTSAQETDWDAILSNDCMAVFQSEDVVDQKNALAPETNPRRAAWLKLRSDYAQARESGAVLRADTEQLVKATLESYPMPGDYETGGIVLPEVPEGEVPEPSDFFVGDWEMASTIIERCDGDPDIIGLQGSATLTISRSGAGYVSRITPGGNTIIDDTTVLGSTITIRSHLNTNRLRYQKSVWELTLQAGNRTMKGSTREDWEEWDGSSCYQASSVTAGCR